jgi:DNA polymerase-1
VAEPGHKLISADYSQLELRLLAHITRDEVMLDAFQKGDDIHNRTSRLVFAAKSDAELKEARRFSKIVNFAIAYAIEPWGLSQRVGISRQEARKVIDELLRNLQRGCAVTWTRFQCRRASMVT